jgi:glutamate-1-semialdehyde aminotransferase
MLEGNLSVSRPEAMSPFEAYVIQKLEKIEDGIEAHDSKFEAIFYCFDQQGRQLERVEKMVEQHRARISHLEFLTGIV